MDCDMLCQEIWKLNGLLGRERDKCFQERKRRIQLCNEVNETKKTVGLSENHEKCIYQQGKKNRKGARVATKVQQCKTPQLSKDFHKDVGYQQEEAEESPAERY